MDFTEEMTDDEIIEMYEKYKDMNVFEAMLLKIYEEGVIMDKDILEERLYQMGEQIKRLELIKESSKKTIEDCDKLIDDINSTINEFRTEMYGGKK